MKKYFLLITLLFLLIFSSITFAKNNSESMSLEEIQKNYILVKYKNGKIKKRLISDFVEPKMKSMSLDLSIENNEVEIKEAIKIANENDEIELSEPIIIFTADNTLPNDINPNDPWRFDIIGMNDLWEDFESIDFSQVTVAVIDTGIDMDNPDFNIDTVNAYDFANGDNTPNDDHGHGSHVSGVIGAIANNSEGIVGIAGNVKIMPLKVLDAGGSGTNEDVALAIRHAADNNADIINMSLGSNVESAIVRDAVVYAYDEGVTIISSSGNGSNHWTDGEDADEYGGSTRSMSTMGYPAAFTEVISVGSVQYLNAEIYISDFSECSGEQEIDGNLQDVNLDVVAPGSRIYSFISDGSIYSLSGTSMSSPHVAGLAAILKAKYSSLDNVQIREIINNTAIDTDIIIPTYSGVNDDEIFGNGLINIKNAFGFDGLKTLDIKAYDSLNNELSISGYNFDQLDYSYNLEVPESTVKIVFDGSTVMSNSSVLNNEDAIPNVLLTKLIDTENTIVEISVETNYGSSINQLYQFNITKKVSSSYLENLIITDHDLAPIFAKDTLTYSISDVTYNTDLLEITAVKVNDTDVVLAKINDGQFVDISQTVPLEVGENIIYIKVYPENDELDYRIYTISVVRNEDTYLNNLTVTDHIILEEFEKDRLIYNISDVSYESYEIEVSATKVNETDIISMKVNDGEYKINETQIIALNVGDNVINVKVENGPETKEYSILVTRLVEGIHLNNLIVTNHTLSPIFNKSHVNYSVPNVTYDISDLDIVATKAENDDVILIKINDGNYVTTDTQTVLLDVGENTIFIKVHRFNDELDYKIYEISVIRLNELYLNDLVVQNHMLSPVFNKYTVNYELAEVSYETNVIDVSATKTTETDIVSMKVNSAEYVPDATQTIPLIVGDNIVYIKVENGDLTVEYSISVTRSEPIHLKNLDVSNYTISPEFNKTILDYSVPDVPYATNSLEIIATKSKESDEVLMKVNDGNYIANSTQIILLDVEENKIYVKVNNENEFKKYIITVNRIGQSTDNTLESLSVTGYNINFTNDNHSYSLTVGNTVSNTTVNAKVNNPKATLNINGEDFVTQNGSKLINLSYGTNRVNIVVTAENGFIGTYTIVVTRESAPPSDPPSGGGSSGGGGGTYIPPSNVPLAAPKAEPEDDVIITEDENGKVTMEISLNKEKFVEILNASENIEIDPLNENNANEIRIIINQEILEIIKNSEKTIYFKFENVILTLNSEILNKLNIVDSLVISSKNVDNKLINSTETFKGNLVSNIYDINIYDGESLLSNVECEIPITLLYNSSTVKNRDKISVFHYDEETGIWQYVGGKVSLDGKIMFDATHFSKYAVKEYNKTFDDIQGHWAQNDIEILASKKITNGVSNKEFAPDKEVTNAEFVVLLSRIFNLENAPNSAHFMDVPYDAWYKKNLNNASNANMLIDSYEYYFNPNDPIKREDMANILVNSYFYYTDSDESDIFITQHVRFNDEGAILQKLKNKVAISNALGLINGDDLGNFNPQNGATRAEASTVIKRLLKFLELM